MSSISNPVVRQISIVSLYSLLAPLNFSKMSAEEAKPAKTTSAEYIPHDREVVMACVELWKSDPKTETLGMAKLQAAVKAAHPDWAVSANRLKSCLKAVNLMPQTVEQKQQISHDQQYSDKIKSKEMPGLDLAARASKQVRVVTTKARGKGFHAVKEIAAGTTLWEEQPLVLAIPVEIVPLARQGVACAYCGRQFQMRNAPSKNSTNKQGPAGTTRCSQQQTCGARYCDPKCRAKDLIHAATWHTSGSGLGKINQEAWIKFEDCCVSNKWMSAYAFGIVLLTRLRLESTAAVGKQSLFRQQYESLATVGHDVRYYSATKGSVQTASMFGAEQTEELWRQVHSLLAAAVSRRYDLSYREFLDGVGAWNLNNVNEAIFMMQSHLNHSCEPNVHAKFHSKRVDGLEIVTILDIKAGEELKVTYVDPKLGLDERQDQLRKNWGFICVCPRCKREQKALAEANKS